MAKVEILKERNGFVVQVTWREPFEDMFEIAAHVARFENRLDAIRLQERVSAAVKAVGWDSPSKVLDAAHWNYRSSVYDGRFNAVGPAPVVVPTSARALAQIEAYDRAC